MENLIKSLSQLDSWLKNQSWLSTIVGFCDSTISGLVGSTNAGLNYCRYLFAASALCAVLMWMVGGSFIIAGVFCLANLLIGLRVIDGIASMRTSSILTALADTVPLIILTWIGCEVVALIVSLFSIKTSMPPFLFGTGSDMLFIIGLMICKNLLDRDVIETIGMRATRY
jgi:hypothetical protein